MVDGSAAVADWTTVGHHRSRDRTTDQHAAVQTAATVAGGHIEPRLESIEFLPRSLYALSETLHFCLKLHVCVKEVVERVR